MTDKLLQCSPIHFGHCSETDKQVEKQDCKPERDGHVKAGQSTAARSENCCLLSANM